MACWMSCWVCRRNLRQVRVICGQPRPEAAGFSGAGAARISGKTRCAYRIVEQDTYSVVKRVLRRARRCARCARAAPRRAVPHRGRTGRHQIAWATTATTCWRPSSSTCSTPDAEGDAGEAAFGRRPHIVIRRSSTSRGRPGRLRRAARFPADPCTLCGSQENLQRKVVGRMLKEWEKPSRAASPPSCGRSRRAAVAAADRNCSISPASGPARPRARRRQRGAVQGTRRAFVCE